LVIASTLTVEGAPASGQLISAGAMGHLSAVPHRMSLRRQARALYAPVAAYENSTTAAQRARVTSAGKKDGRRIDACQAPYLHRLRLSTRPGAQKLYFLYFDGAGMEGNQSKIAPVAKQLTTLAAAWSRLRLSNRPMNDFAHGAAAEFRASLNTPRFDACAFIRAIAAHHYSYSWARQSPAGKTAKRYEMRLEKAGEQTNAFWTFVGATGLPGASSAPGANLFTQPQLTILGNLPGEVG
jgi:hypothetical protein